MIFKSVDARLRKIGFIKTLENEYGVSYRRKRKNDGYGVYIQRLDILHKDSGKHLIQSYQEGVNSDGFNNMVGLTYKEARLAMKKYWQLKRKYGWKTKR